MQSINAHSLRSALNSSFPGNNYSDLAKWLLQKPTQLLPGPAPHHELVTLYDLGHTSIGGSHSYTQSQLGELASVSSPPKDHVQVLFVRGFLTPDWISLLGSKYSLDPELILRHLDFFATSTHRHLYSNPSLASTNNNIIQLCVTTIFHKDKTSKVSIHDDVMLEHRKVQCDELASYKRKIRTLASCGESLVRDYYTLDDQYSVCEQRISICIVKNGEGWLSKSLTT